MNTEYMNLLNQTIITALADDINKKLTEEGKKEIKNTPEEVFANLPMLYDTVQEMAFGEATGNSYRFMPKHYKAMVMRLVAPEYYPDVKISYTKMEDGTLTGVCAEAKLFLNKDDNRPVASGKQYLSFEAVEEQFKDEKDLHSYVESTVRGIALSKAYQEFGIGSWYTYRFEPEENPNAVLAAMSESDKVNPTIAYGDEDELVKNTKNVETSKNGIETVAGGVEQKTEEKETQNPESEPLQQAEKSADPADEIPRNDIVKASSDKPVSKSKKMETAKESSDPNSPLDVARSRKAPTGKAAALNLTLGETEDKFPGNIFWLYMQSNISSDDKDALKLIALNNPKIKDLFLSNGVNI